MRWLWALLSGAVLAFTALVLFVVVVLLAFEVWGRTGA